MYKNLRVTKKGVLSVVGAIALIGLLIVGLLSLQQRAEQVRRDEAIRIAQQNLEEQATQPIATDTDTAPESGSTARTPSEDSDATTEELPATGIQPVNLMAVVMLATAFSYYITSSRAVRQSGLLRPFKIQ